MPTFPSVLSMESWINEEKETSSYQIEQPFSSITVKTESKSSIASLDGLRGIACLIVFNEHFTANYNDSFYYGYGVENKRTIIQLPFIRTLWGGAGMVAVFFVISGYVLSYKPLKLMRNNQHEKAHATLSSSVFRRFVRLYLPSIAAVLISGFLSWAGVFNAGASNFYDEGSGLKLHEDPPPRYENFFVQMWDAFKNAMHMVSLWYWGRINVTPGNYDWHLWTILVEYRSSMVLFILLLATSRLQQLFRLICSSVMIGYCVYTDRRDVLLFICGMFLAEIDMIRKSEDKDDGKKLSWVLMFGISVYLMSAPVYGAEKTFGYKLLTDCIPKYYFDSGVAIASFGSILMVWCVANSSRLECLFTNPFTNYLGKISYSLYLVHGGVIRALLYAIIPDLLKMTGAKHSSTGMVLAWFLGLAMVFPVTIVLSDLFWRTIDIPSVDFARWLERMVSINDDKDQGENGQYHLISEQA